MSLLPRFYELVLCSSQSSQMVDDHNVDSKDLDSLEDFKNFKYLEKHDSLELVQFINDNFLKLREELSNQTW